MQTTITYQCDVCKKQSHCQKEIHACEAKHMGLSYEEYQHYELLKQQMIRACWIVSDTNNDRTRAEEELAIRKVLEFEKKHNLKGD